MDNRALHDTFAAFGPILSCVVASDASGQSKGFAFVQFEQEESAKAAIEKVNGMLLAGRQVGREGGRLTNEAPSHSNAGAAES